MCVCDARKRVCGERENARERESEAKRGYIAGGVGERGVAAEGAVDFHTRRHFVVSDTVIESFACRAG